MRRRAILCCLLLLLSTGCAKVELNEQLIARLVAVDAAPSGGVRVTVRYVVPKLVRLSGSGSGAATEIGGLFRGEGQNLADALADLQRHAPRRLIWSHLSAIVLGEGYARRGVRPALDYLARQPDVGFDSLVVTAPGRADALLSAHVDVEVSIATSLERLSELQSMPKVTLKTFLWALERQGEQPTTASFILDPQGGPLFTGAALYREDRLDRWLDPEQTRALLWFWGEMKEETITFDNVGGSVSLQVQGKPQIRARIEGGQPQVTARFSVIAYLLEVDGSNQIDPVGLGLIERVAAEYMTRRAERIVALLQKEGLDSLRLNRYVERADPRGWARRAANWKSGFVELPVKVESIVTVQRSGRKERPAGQRLPVQGGKR